MGLFSSSKSSTTQTVMNVDERFGAAEGGQAFRIDGSSNINIGSDELASQALDSNRDALTIAGDLIRETIEKAYNQTDNRAQAAEKNLAAAQASTQDILQKSQETADDRLMKLIAIIAATGLGAIYFLKRK